MIFRTFYIKVVLQVILIVLTALAIAYTFTVEYMLITRYSLLVLLLLEVIYLVFFINKVNRQIIRFLDSFQYDHNRILFSGNKSNRDSRNLNNLFDKIIERFENIKIEKEKESQFFSSAIQHVATGLIGFNEKGDVLIVNKAFLDLFKIQNINTIEKLESYKNGIVKLLKSLKPNQIELIQLNMEGKQLAISVNASIMRIENELIRLVSFQDISNEIDRKEIEAWQKLIRVINHEIINSLSPVNLLSSTLIRSIEKNKNPVLPSEIDKVKIENIYRGLQAIKNRSQGLTQFVENYRNVMQLPEPKFTSISVRQLFIEIQALFREELSGKKISMKITADPKLIIYADKKMIEQVIINLIKNSIQALAKAKQPEIRINAYQDKNQIIISIADNGTGITDDIKDNIFIPYFSTKEGGSGIGLSLSRQIMKLHGGNISMHSKPGKETIFILSLKNS